MKTKITSNTKTIGQNLKTLRQIRQISQVDLAKILGVTFQQVQKYERGTNRLPVDKLHRAKEELNVPYDFFFKGMEGSGNGQSLKKLNKEIQTEIRKISNRNTLLNILSLLHIVQSHEINPCARKEK